VSERNETNALWRAVRAEATARRDAEEQPRITRLYGAARKHGWTVTRLDEHGYRIVGGSRVVDYWPRTGRWREVPGKETRRGWVALLGHLRPRGPGKEEG